MKNLYTGLVMRLSLSLSLSLALSLPLALLASPALAHGAHEIHTHPEDMIGLAALVALAVVGGYILWKNRA